MKGLCKTLIFTIISIFSLSCSKAGIYDGPDSGTPLMTGKVTDMNGNPIEHIMVTIDWGAAAEAPDIEYTDSDGKFMFRYRFSGSNDNPATVMIRLDDIDGEANGGHFESRTESMTLFSSGNGAANALTFRLNRATV